MIFYFSATGNSEYIASRIAAATGEKMLSMVDCLDRRKLYYTVPAGERVGIVTPTYCWGIPNIVRLFMKYIRFSYEKRPYFYYVTTYGSTPGQSSYFCERCLKKHNHVSFDGLYSIKMPNTWTPIFNMNNEEGLKRIHGEVEMRIGMLIDRIVCCDAGDFQQEKAPVFFRSLYRPTYDKIRQTSNFHVEENCSSCGLCAASCPVRAIELREGRPVWVKERCVMCLGCLHRCPEFSIQFGKMTKKHGQYQHPSRFPTMTESEAESGTDIGTEFDEEF